MTERHAQEDGPANAVGYSGGSIAERWGQYEWSLSEDGRRAKDRGEFKPEGMEARVITYGLLTADGALGFVSSSVYELRRFLDEQRQLKTPERGQEDLPVVPGLKLYHAEPAEPRDWRPLNHVANTLIKALDPERPYGKFRGTVAFIATPRYCDITADQREALMREYRTAHASVRRWQASKGR